MKSSTWVRFGALFTVCATLLPACDTATQPSAVAAVSIEEHAGELEVGASSGFVAVARDRAGNPLEDRRLFWASEDNDVATVSDEGVVTAVAAGETRIAASSEGQSDLVELTVRPVPVASVVVEPGEATLRVGDGVSLEATPLDRDGNALTDREVTWSSSASEIASVDGSGEVTAERRGEATITATSEGESGSAEVRVRAGPPVRLELRPAEDTLRAIGASLSLSVAAEDAAGDEVHASSIAWESLDADIATVSDDGEVSARRNGTARIRAAAGELADTATVVVRQEVSSVSVSREASSIRVAESVRFTATAEDAEGVEIEDADFAWSSSDESVATVDAQGLVEGVNLGTAQITASSDGVSASAAVLVETGAVASMQVESGDGQSGRMGREMNDALVVRLLDAAGNPVSGQRVTWEASHDGSVRPPRSNSDSDGFASTEWTVGGDAFTQTVTASVEGVDSVTFRATVLPF